MVTNSTPIKTAAMQINSREDRYIIRSFSLIEVSSDYIAIPSGAQVYDETAYPR